MKRIDREAVRKQFREESAVRRGARKAEGHGADGVWDLVVTVHPAYFGEMLHECMRAWDAERVPGQKILVVDDGGMLSAVLQLRSGWQIVAGKWGHPSGARNAGLEVVRAPWVVHWDADNVPRQGLGREFSRAVGAASDRAGYVGPGAPDGDARDFYGVDTNALWRVEAIRAVGGWPWTLLEDWRLGWMLAGAGWAIERMAGAPIERRRHGLQRTHQADEDAKLWSARDFGLVSLHRGDRALSERWLAALAAQELPERLGVTVICDGEDLEYCQWMETELRRILGHWSGTRRRRVEVFFSPGQALPAVPTEDYHGRQARHERVYQMYQWAFARTPEPWIWTWEDDVFPESPGALRALQVFAKPWHESRPGYCVAVAGAAYPERYDAARACASTDAEVWRREIDLAEVETPMRVGSTAAGLTFWRRSDWETLDASLGRCWDFAMNRAARRRGGESWLLPVLCAHEVEPVPEGPEGTLLTAVTQMRGVVDSGAGVMLRNQMLQILLPAVVAQLIRVLSEEKLKALARHLISQLKDAVQATPNKVDDATVLPIAEHFEKMLD